MATETARTKEQSVGDLFGRLTTLSGELVRDEFALARHEIQQKLNVLKIAVVLAIVAATIGQVALLALCAGAVLALTPVIGAWQAALAIGGALAFISVTFALVGLARLKRMSLMPEQTIETMEENKKWLKQQLS